MSILVSRLNEACHHVIGLRPGDTKRSSSTGPAPGHHRRALTRLARLTVDILLQYSTVPS
jgi:hypothetical protein